MEDPLDGSSKGDVRLQWPARAHGSELSQLSRDIVESNLYRLINSLYKVDVVVMEFG